MNKTLEQGFYKQRYPNNQYIYEKVLNFPTCWGKGKITLYTNQNG